MVQPAESAVPLRIFHLNSNVAAVIAKVYLDIFHPPFAVGIVALKPFGHVNHYLGAVRTGNVDGAFIVVNLQRACGVDGEAALEAFRVLLRTGSLAAHARRCHGNETKNNDGPSDNALGP